MPIQTPDAAVYAGDPLNPIKIVDNLDQTRLSWTTIILSLFHIGDIDKIWTIYFNDYPVVVDGKVVEMFANWNESLSQLLQGGSVRKLYASFGGGDPVRDFTAISNAYKSNCNSFHNSLLEFNLKEFRRAFPAITGIDMDIEDGYHDDPTYDKESFTAFCKLVHELGYDISFCPYGSYDSGDNTESIGFLTDRLIEIEKSDWGKGVVKRFNVQYDYVNASSSPQEYINRIKSALPDFDTNAFFSIGCWARFIDEYGEWDKMCPPDIVNEVARWKQYAPESICGGWIWDMDFILQTSLDPTGCNGYAFQGDYRNAIFEGLVKKP